MGDGNQKKPLGDINGLLCAATLKAALRSAHDSALPAREGMKELFTTSSLAKEEPSNTDILSANGTTDSEFSRWERCLEVLVEEFLQRKSELLRLNKARRDQIEDFLRRHSKSSVSLEQVVSSRIGSPEHEALLLFAHEVSVFQLLQILLVKRWRDRGLLLDAPAQSSGHTLNWQITSFLKRNSPQGLLSRHEWSFLKQNVFTWYSPAKEVSERLRRLMEAVNLSQESSDFPARLLRSLGARSRLSLLGFTPTLIDSHALWQLLLEQKAFDLRLDSAADLDFASEASGAILISGLGNGESLNSLRELSQRRELHGVWAFTDSEFERFLSEMFILWDCASEIPRINLHPRTVLKDVQHDRSASLFQNCPKIPYQAQFAACFQDPEGKELEDASALLEQLRENGLLLISSGHFWPTDASDRCERLREQTLKHSVVRLIIDLRQLTGSAGENLPTGVTILEKCSSKELRDSNRPQILRVRGHLQKHQVAAFWAAVLEYIRHESHPGDVNVKSLTSVGEGVRLEVMAAAASQQQLRSSPWVTLSDPFFYEASGRLRRIPSKAFTLGTIFRWKSGMNSPSHRGILLQEFDKSLQAALTDQENFLKPDAPHYLFLPEKSIAEHPIFFVSQVYSAPVQFWFRLELEQNSAKRARSIDRQSEQRLKLMPLIRLFEPGTLHSVPKSLKPISSLEDLRKELSLIFRQPLGMAERSRLHEIVLSLESAIAQSIELCGEFTRHLYPELPIPRWELPATLPEVAPHLALEIFRHLDRSPLMQHPAIHVTKLRNVHDFKVTNSIYEEMPMGGMAELKIFHGIDPIFKLSGPALLLRATNDELQRRLGRPWRETTERMLFPTDFMLVQTQLREVLRSAEHQLATTREHLAVMDQIFCCLFGLTSSFSDDNIRLAIRRHLSPEESRIQVQFAPKDNGIFRPANPASSIGILQ